MTGTQECESQTTQGSEPDTDPEVQRLVGLNDTTESPTCASCGTKSRLVAYLSKIARPSEWPSALLDSLTNPRASRWALWTGTGLTMLASALSTSGIIDQAVRARDPDADPEKRGIRVALICTHSALLAVNMGACSVCCALLWSGYTADAARTAGMRRVEERMQNVPDASSVELVLFDEETGSVLHGDQRDDLGVDTEAQLTGNGSTLPMPEDTSTSQ